MKEDSTSVDLLQAVSGLGAGFIIYDREFRYRLWNKFMEEMTGLKAEEVLGKPALELFPHLREEGVEELLGRALKGESVSSPDTPYRIPKTGKSGWFVGFYSPYLDAQGKAIGVVAIIRDITERKSAETSLRESRERFRLLFEQAADAVVLVDAETLALVDFNDIAHRNLGYTREELLRLRVQDLEVVETPEEVERHARKIRREGSDTFETRIRTKQGNVRDVLMKARLVSLEGKDFLLGIWSDVTQRKRAEEALRRSERELTIRNRISDVFLSTSDDEVYSQVLEVVLEALESKYGFLGHIDDDGALVCPSMTKDIWDRCQMADKTIVFPREKWAGLWGRSLVERKSIFANEPLHVPEGHIPLSRALSVPLLYRERLLGIIVVANKTTDYDQEDVKRLEKIGSHVGSILHARLQRDRQYRARMRAEEKLKQLRRQLKSGDSFAGIVGRDPTMLEVFDSIREVAQVDVPVLIQGESGTGKELVAAAIHNEGPRANKPIVPVHCSALPESLLESELFGHVRGAFTGAIRDKKGRFELADGGTIFLDEIGELSHSIQVSLLRVLQEGTIERVGSEKITKIDVRVISATNRDMERLVASGRFRKDLYYRLCVVPLHLPPLRERGHDILLLANHITRQVSEESGRKDLVLSQEALDAVTRHDWPGNVRELQNAILYASVKCKGDVIESRHLPPSVSGNSSSAPAKRGRKSKLNADDVERVLRETGGNKAQAARRLGVSRATLYTHLGRLNGGS
jgi:PAS domain S-box-containing protein